jgi:nucleotide-binding universal stress UspA family protein
VTSNVRRNLRVLILVDALHPQELLEALERFVSSEVDLLLVYVEGPSARAGLEMLGHRPGGARMPPHRAHGLAEAEATRATDALAEAEKLARRRMSAVEVVTASGEAGQVVCGLAARRQVDLVVVRAGGRDRPPAGPKSLGPAARFITDHSPCPVLLLR